MSNDVSSHNRHGDIYFHGIFSDSVRRSVYRLRLPNKTVYILMDF